MKKITFLIFLFTSITGYSQKEIYFTSSREDSITISSLHFLNAEIASNFNQSGISTSINTGYFYELKITKKSVLLTGINLINSIYSYYPDLSNPNVHEHKYGLQLSVQAEPRWYIDYNKRVINGKNSRLNTSWYLGIPVTLATNYLLINPDINLNLITSGIVGFRYALSENLFIDSSAGIGLYTDFILISPAPYFKLKLGYCFK